MGIEIRNMMIADYESMITLWKSSEGIGISSADERDQIDLFLKRNPETCFVALEDGKLVGTILGGNDGRRGYLYHMAVAPTHRNRGLARLLSSQCLAALNELGIQRVHIFVYRENLGAVRFWEQTGWYHRPELQIMSFDSK